MSTGIVQIGLVVALLLSVTQGASAMTVEVARACNALVAKQFPSRQVGNPAAGSSKGSARQQREYFKKCVENGGKVEDSPEQPPRDGKAEK